MGMAKAFDELEELGWLENSQRPRLVSVQASGCAPVVRAFETGAVDCEFWIGAHTVASGLRVPKSFAGRLILHDIRRSSGTALAVEDKLILKAQRTLAQVEGDFGLVVIHFPAFRQPLTGISSDTCKATRPNRRPSYSGSHPH